MLDPAILLILLGTALAASIFSIRLGVSVAIIEIVFGMLLGNLGHLRTDDYEWLAFLASLGSVVLTFLAGAEIDPEALRRTWKASLTIGLLSFVVPFLLAWLFSYLVLGWTWDASLLAGVAISTTSVAVVYVVLVETGISRTEIGKIILSSCFITDLGTAVALSTLFTRPNAYLLALVAALVVSTLFVPRLLKWLFRSFKTRTGEPDVKLLLVLVVGLGALAQTAGVHAVLPAYILGLIAADTLASNREVLLKVRALSLSFLTPFFFIGAGMSVSFGAVVAGAGLIAVLFFLKVGAKFLGVLYPCNVLVGRDSVYITLLMSTGLTFGTISAQVGLSSGIIDTNQFSVLVMTVMLTAIIPTAIAQRMFTLTEGGGKIRKKL
ncbi:MAG: cation:proton antiporter [Thermoplasmata archaeon]